MEHVWLFNAEQSSLPGGVFSSLERAEEWIKTHRLCGTLTKYPVDVSLYDWAVSKGYFEPKQDFHRESWFMASFTCASAEHYHDSDDPGMSDRIQELG